MKRYDLRDLKENFYDRMEELLQKGVKDGEVAIFIFEVGDFSHIQKSADFVKELGYELMNSLKFNEVDWTIVVKKVTKKAVEEEIDKKEVEDNSTEEKKA